MLHHVSHFVGLNQLYHAYKAHQLNEPQKSSELLKEGLLRLSLCSAVVCGGGYFYRDAFSNFAHRSYQVTSTFFNRAISYFGKNSPPQPPTDIPATPDLPKEEPIRGIWERVMTFPEDLKGYFENRALAYQNKAAQDVCRAFQSMAKIEVSKHPDLAEYTSEDWINTCQSELFSTDAIKSIDRRVAWAYESEENAMKICREYYLKKDPIDQWLKSFFGQVPENWEEECKKELTTPSERWGETLAQRLAALDQERVNALAKLQPYINAAYEDPVGFARKIMYRPSRLQHEDGSQVIFVKSGYIIDDIFRDVTTQLKLS